MAIEYYKKAEIYLTTCTHPDFSYLRYVGLDTKCDPLYIGSSVTLKWFKNKIGRKYFHKEILEVTEGTMREICKVEQRYIVEHNAVKDPNYLNMSGGIKQNYSNTSAISLDFDISPTVQKAHEFINNIISELTNSLGIFSHSKCQLIRRILSVASYGYLKYEQEEFEYNRWSHYGSCTDDDLQEILSAMANLNILDSGLNTIKITDEFIDRIPVSVMYENFTINYINN